MTPPAAPAPRRVRKNKDEPSAVAWLWRQTRRRRRRLAVCVLPLLLSSVLVLLLGWGLRQAVDSGLAAAEPAALNLWTALLLLIVAMVAALAWARLFLTARLAEEIVRELRLRLLGGLLRADPRRFTSLRREGAVASALADSTLLQSGLITFFPMALRHLILLLGGLLLGLLTEPRLALVFLFFLSPVVLAVAFLGRRVRGYSRRAQSRLGEVAGLAEEAVAGIETVQAFGGEDEFARRFGAALDSAHVVSLLRVRWRAHLTSVAIGLSSGVAVLIFWLGARDVLAGGLSPGALSAFVFYAVVVAGAAGALGEVSGEVQRILGAAERLGELERMTGTAAETATTTTAAELKKTTTTAAAKTSATTAMELKTTTTAAAKTSVETATATATTTAAGVSLSFRDVHYSYPEGEAEGKRERAAALSGVSFEAAAGELVALVGEVGSGKSTIFRLLLGMDAPNSGAIEADGVPLSRLSAGGLRGCTGLVEQRPWLFTGSLRENLLLGGASVPDADLLALLDEAGAGDLVSRLGRGVAARALDAILEGGGAGLSGGERQLVAIVRALARSPRLLLLDEASASLDALREERLLSVLARLRGRVTVLVTAHRLSTARVADRVVVLSGGRVTESGPHDALVSSGGLYAGFVMIQDLGSSRVN